jgi:hypothetical protein
VRLGVAGGRIVVVPVVLDPGRDGRFALPSEDAEALISDLRRTGFPTYAWRRDQDLGEAFGDRAAAIAEPIGELVP